MVVPLYSMLLKTDLGDKLIIVVSLYIVQLNTELG